MNTPAPVPPNTNPGPTTPSLGAMLGSVLGSAVATKYGNGDAVTSGAIVTTIATFFTWLFHWGGSKLNIPGA